MSTATQTPAAPAAPTKPHTTPPLWWEDDFPHKQSRAAADLAAGKTPLPECSDPPAPEEFPKLLYNKDKRTTKTAASKDDETKLTGEGFAETPFPAEDPDALTPEDTKALEALLAKAGQAVQKIATAVEKQNKEKAPDKAATPATAKK